MKRYKQNRQTTRRVDGTKGDDTKTSARLDECERKTNSPDAVFTKAPMALRTAAKANDRSIEPIIPQNTPADLLHLLLFRVPIEPAFDIALTRPPMLPKGQRFESAEDARAQRDKDYERLDRLGQRDAAKALFMCEPGDPCGRPYCAACGRQFRRWLIGQALRLQAGLDLNVITIAIELVPTKRLEDCDVLAVKRRVTQRFRRAAPSAEFVLGGVEADYREEDDTFLIHAHLLVSPMPRDEMKALRSAFADIGVTRAVKVQSLRDPAAQVSYLLKFPTFHRPGPQNGSRRSRPVPLPDHALEQLTLWRARHGFMDFVLMMGLRRRGGDLVRIEQKP